MVTGGGGGNNDEQKRQLLKTYGAAAATILALYLLNDQMGYRYPRPENLFLLLPAK